MAPQSSLAFALYPVTKTTTRIPSPSLSSSLSRPTQSLLFFTTRHPHHATRPSPSPTRFQMKHASSVSATEQAASSALESLQKTASSALESLQKTTADVASTLNQGLDTLCAKLAAIIDTICTKIEALLPESVKDSWRSAVQAWSKFIQESIVPKLSEVAKEPAAWILATATPKVFMAMVALSLLVTMPGALLLKNSEYLVGFAYGTSVALQGAIALVIMLTTITGSVPTAPMTHAVLLILYGVRLALFLTIRSGTKSYKRYRQALEVAENKEKKVADGKKSNMGKLIKFAFICSILYAALCLPLLFHMKAACSGVASVAIAEPQASKNIFQIIIGWFASLFGAGSSSAAASSSTAISSSTKALFSEKVLQRITSISIATAATGLLVETVADSQKLAHKNRNPGKPCMKGLYSLSRHPNYLGEILFWIGAWAMGIPAYAADWKKWLVSFWGSLGIFLIIARGALNTVDKRQWIKYRNNPDYNLYAGRTPKLIPLFGKKGVYRK